MNVTRSKYNKILAGFRVIGAAQVLLSSVKKKISPINNHTETRDSVPGNTTISLLFPESVAEGCTKFAEMQEHCTIHPLTSQLHPRPAVVAPGLGGAE